jgi:DNA-binding transcriptional regulator YdaS (Cro superfamily)
MKLTEYLATPDQNASILAALVGCETSTITRLAKGERRASADLAVRIEKATLGKVTVHDLVETAPLTADEAAS